MKVQINFKVINPEYNQRYANQYHGGEESESNWKYLWAVSYEIDSAKAVAIIEDEQFLLRGKFEDESPFEFRISNVHILRCHFNDNTHEDFGVSKSVLNKTHQAKREGYDVIRFYFYINSEPPSIHISKNLVLDTHDVPSNLIKGNH